MRETKLSKFLRSLGEVPIRGRRSREIEPRMGFRSPRSRCSPRNGVREERGKGKVNWRDSINLERRRRRETNKRYSAENWSNWFRLKRNRGKVETVGGRRREMVEKFTWNYVGRYSDDSELCGATHTRVVRLWRERGRKTERHDGNYVCIIFNFSNILRRNGRGSGVAPYDSCDYEKPTIATAFGIDDPNTDGSVKAENRYSIYRTRFLSSTHDSAHFLFSRAKRRPVRNRGIVR